MTEDEIGKQVVDVETMIDSLASWREDLSSSPTNSADEPDIRTAVNVSAMLLAMGVLD